MTNVLVIDSRPTRPGSDWTTSGLPHAVGYYRTFPHEPSPLGDIDFDSGDIHPLTANVSLGTVLAQLMLASGGGVAVLVCHAWSNSNGLLIPVAPGGTRTNLSPSAMTGIDQAIDAEKSVAAIKTMPRSTDANREAAIAAWSKLINSLQANAISGTFTEAEAQKWYDRWFLNLANQLEFTTAAPFRQLLTAVQTMRTTHLSRLELRACQIGSDTKTMEQLRKFFGMLVYITAPVFATFFGIVPVATLIDLRRPGGNLGPSLGQNAEGAFLLAEDNRIEQLLTETDTTRGFVKERLEPYTGQASLAGFFPIGILGWFKFLPAFVLRIRETTPYVVETHAWVTAQGPHHDPDLGVVNKFVQAMILPSSGFRDRNLPFAGFFTPSGKEGWAQDRQSLPWVLPNEPEYRSSIKTSP